MEEAIQQAVNEAGVACTKYALSQFDTDDKPIEVEDRKCPRASSLRGTNKIVQAMGNGKICVAEGCKLLEMSSLPTN